MGGTEENRPQGAETAVSPDEGNSKFLLFDSLKPLKQGENLPLDVALTGLMIDRDSNDWGFEINSRKLLFYYYFWHQTGKATLPGKFLGETPISARKISELVNSQDLVIAYRKINQQMNELMTIIGINKRKFGFLTSHMGELKKLLEQDIDFPEALDLLSETNSEKKS